MTRRGVLGYSVRQELGPDVESQPRTQEKQVFFLNTGLLHFLPGFPAGLPDFAAGLLDFPAGLPSFPAGLLDFPAGLPDFLAGLPGRCWREPVAGLLL